MYSGKIAVPPGGGGIVYLNSTYQYQKKNSQDNELCRYLKFKVSREVSRFLCRSVYLDDSKKIMK
jgi:hypothetical protein